LKRFTAATKSSPGALQSKWSSVGDQLLWKGMFDNYQAMQAHQERLMELVDELVASTGAQLGRLEIHGPLAEAIAASDKIDPSMALQADFYDLEEGFFSRLTPETPDTLCATQMYFDVSDWTKARPVMSEFLDRTTKESGCLYSGWSKKNNEMVWRESYADGDSVATHFTKTGPLINKLLSGPAKLTRVEIHGPKEELKKTGKDIIKKAITATSIEPEYFAITESGDEEKLQIEDQKTEL
jgi:quinol monooxygenase YgiN